MGLLQSAFKLNTKFKVDVALFSFIKPLELT